VGSFGFGRIQEKWEEVFDGYWANKGVGWRSIRSALWRRKEIYTLSPGP
jgi:hypothetical protein